MELTWIGGGLVMIGLVGIVVWPCISVLFHMKRDSPITVSLTVVDRDRRPDKNMQIILLLHSAVFSSTTICTQF